MCDSNQTIWKLRKTKKHFDLKAGENFVLTAVEAPVLRKVYDIYESSYRIMGGNLVSLGGGKQVNH